MPTDLRSCAISGAAQTIDQLKLFGSAVRWFADAPTPGDGVPDAPIARELARRLVHEATRDRPGPVHLNCSFREPLRPLQAPGHFVPEPSAATRFVGSPRLDDASVHSLAARFGAAERGVVVVGPNDLAPADCEAVVGLAARLGWPLLSEGSGPLRFGPHTQAAPILGAAETILAAPEAAAALRADEILRIGAPPTGKATNAWIASQEGALCVLDPSGGSDEPLHVGADHLHAALAPTCRSLTEAIDEAPGGSAWLDRWQQADRIARATSHACLDRGPFGSLQVARALDATLPDGATLSIGNSRAIRDWDAQAAVSTRPLRVLSQRGANGIDGNLSAALGAATALAPCTLWVGDLAFLHDASALFGARELGVDLTVVVSNDGGGGIFDALPVAPLGDAVDFERSFRVAHGQRAVEIAAAYGVAAETAADEAGLRDRLAAPASGVRLVEVPIDAGENQSLHERVQREVATALAEAAPWR